MKLGDYLKAINSSKKNLFEEDEDGSVKKGYTPFIVNRCLSYFPDTLVAANTMNQFAHLDKEAQFLYYLHDVRRGNRFSRWAKKQDEKVISHIMELYDVSTKKATGIAEILSDKEKKKVSSLVEKGGKKS